ncbi:MAG: hypothetical protein M1824_002109 [Vezdaea acicularis]|nr:MAG: hypothetical protein M1824_002109 [Vezdaea acicularis]
MSQNGSPQTSRQNGREFKLSKPNGHHTSTEQSQLHSSPHQAPMPHVDKKYRHTTAIHTRPKTSVLSHDSDVAPSFLGFRNLMIIVLVVSNLRLMVENFIKYGVLICVRCHDYRRQDVYLGIFLYLLVPCHLLAAYIIELAAAKQALGIVGRRKKADWIEASPEQKQKERQTFQSTWRLLAFSHGINITLCLLITTFTVYFYIHHPLIGTLCMFHAVIVWLKVCSYAFTNRDLRYTLLSRSSLKPLPEIYNDLPYPRNITLSNLTYFWWAPTLVYQPVYPRSSHIRWLFVLKRVTEVAALSTFIWIATAQYAAPVLRNSLTQMQKMNMPSIIERLMKLSTISLVIWLAGFFALFQSFLNALAEVMKFGDREFYTDWWNSPSVGVYWRTWNKPVYQFMKRHIFLPMVSRGWSSHVASAAVFVFSGILHELLVGVPTHNIIGVAFFGMVIQLPMIWATVPLERMQGVNGKIIGNVIFWKVFGVSHTAHATEVHVYFRSGLRKSAKMLIGGLAARTIKEFGPDDGVAT